MVVVLDVEPGAEDPVGVVLHTERIRLVERRELDFKRVPLVRPPGPLVALYQPWAVRWPNNVVIGDQVMIFSIQTLEIHR